MSWWNVGALAVSVVGSVISYNSASSTASAAQQAADLQWDIANRIQRRRDELFDMWRTVFRPGELALKAQVAALRPYEVDYNRTTSRGRSQIRRQYGEARRTTSQVLARNCLLSPPCLLNDLLTRQGGAEAWASNGLIRAEDNLKRVLDVQNRQERLQFMQMGRQAYFKTGGGEMAAKIAANLQNIAQTASASNSAATGSFITSAFNYAGKAWESYNAPQREREAASETPALVDNWQTDSRYNPDQDAKFNSSYPETGVTTTDYEGGE